MQKKFFDFFKMNFLILFSKNNNGLTQKAALAIVKEDLRSY